MLALLQILLVGHVHHWKEDDRRPLLNYNNERIGLVSFCTCTKCGKPKRFNLA